MWFCDYHWEEISKEVSKRLVAIYRSSILNSFTSIGPHVNQKETRGPSTLALCFTQYKKCQFSADLSLNTLLQTIEILGYSYTVPQIHISNWDNFQKLNCDLSMSLKVKCGGTLGHRTYGFLLEFISNIWFNSTSLPNIILQNLNDIDFDPSRSYRFILW